MVGLKENICHSQLSGYDVLIRYGMWTSEGYLPEMNFTGDDINTSSLIMVFVVVEMTRLRKFLADIATAIGTGKNGDGKVFVTEVLDKMRIRTNERGDDALM